MARPSAAPTLDGRAVRLEPLTRDHAAGLAEIALDPAIWRWMPVPAPVSLADVERFVEAALALAADGRTAPFATIERETGKPIGSTRFLEIVPEHRRLEIGWTWVAPPWQRTAANSEAKLLMLSHAFETLGCRRVEFKTHAANTRSRAALLGIGATSEGVFRKHMSMPDGSIRDSAWYSIVDDEWPEAKARLEARVERLLHTGEA